MDEINKSAMPPDQKQKCHIIIHSASVGSAVVGAATAARITMIISLGKVFDQTISKEAAKELVNNMLAATVGSTVARAALSWIPVVGIAVNLGTAGGVTEYIGWKMAENFYQNQLRELGENTLSDDTNDNAESYEVDEEHGEEVLQRRAKEFIRGEKGYIESREDYNTLLDDFEYAMNRCPDGASIEYSRLLATYERLCQKVISDPIKIVSTSNGHNSYSKLSDALVPEQNIDHSFAKASQLVLYDVFSTEETGCYRVTAKVNYAPIHVGDTCALLANGRATNQTIKVLQIGIGEHQWLEKEPDKITTLIVSGAFGSTSELTNQRFICIKP